VSGAGAGKNFGGEGDLKKLEFVEGS